MIISGEGTGLGKKSTLYPLGFVTIICVHYIFDASAYLECSAPSRATGLKKMRVHVPGKRCSHSKIPEKSLKELNVISEDGDAELGKGVIFPQEQKCTKIGPWEHVFAVSMLLGRQGSQFSVHQSNPQILNGLWPPCWPFRIPEPSSEHHFNF